MSGPSWAPELEKRLARAQREWRAPSVAAAVVRDGELVWSSAVGAADPGDGRAATAETSYRLGSITKSFTAVLVLQLRDEGLLDLDDPLERHLPGTRHGGVTLRRMLSHLSGLRREPAPTDRGEVWVTLEVLDRDALLDGFERAEPVLPPHTAWHYSNLAYAVLGEVVARRTGTTWEDALQQRLLDPLGLSRTTLEPTAPRAVGTSTHPYADVSRVEPDAPSGAVAPAMQLWSTAADSARWAGFLADPDPSVLRPETLEEMRRPHAMWDPHAWTLAWGLGLMLYRKGERVLHGHAGAMPGHLAGAVAYRDDRERLGVAVLTNTGRGAAPDDLAVELATAVLDTDPRPAPAWAPGAPVPPDLEPLLGPWWSEGSESLVEWRDGRLTAIARGAPEWRRTVFADLDRDTWRAERGREQGEVLRVVRREDGTIGHLLFAGYAYTREPLVFGEPL